MKLPTPTVDKVIALDGNYANERELFLAAIADGMTPVQATYLVEDFAATRDKEWAEQQEAEIRAENAWLRHAESAGFYDTELDAQYGV